MLNNLVRPAAWLGSVAVMMGTAGAQAQESPASPETALQFLAQQAGEGPGTLQERLVQTAKGLVKLSDYYLGLECFPVEGALRAQLDLGDEAGLLVEQVLPDSPAAKAGFKRYDVLLTAGDAKLKEAKDLIAAVDEAKDKEVAVTLLRGGKKMTISAAPSKRPEGKEFEAAVGPRPRPEEMLRLLEKAAGPNGQPLQFRMLGPGAMFHGGPAPEMPKNLRLSITKEGGEPAKITVKRDDETWEVTDKSLDKLPDDVRKHVEHFLGRGGKAFAFGGSSGPMGSGGIVGGGAGGVFPGPGGVQQKIEVRRVEKKDGDKDDGDKFKELSGQIEMLKQQLDKIEKHLPKQDEK